MPTIALENRGRRECRVLQPAPAASRDLKEAHEQVTTGRAEITGIPCANGLTVSFVLSPVNRAFLPSLLLKNLTPASGCQDHTTSPSAHNVIRLLTWPASIASRLTFRDDSAYAPLAEAGRREGTIFSRPMKSRKFLQAHLDDPNQLDWSCEFRFYAQGNFKGFRGSKAARAQCLNASTN
jgi:hypothetical protein